MISSVMLLVSMSLQAVLIIGVVFGIRKLFAMAHISKKYVMLLWMIPFFFLIFPWKIAVPRGFWNSAAAELTAELYGMEEADTKAVDPNADFNSDSQQGQIGGDFGFEKEQKLQELQNADGADKLQESELMPDGGDISDERQGKSRHIATDLWEFWGNVQKNLLTAEKGENRMIFGVLSVVWAAGMVFFLLRGAVSYRRLRRNVLCSVPCGECMQDRKHAAVYLTDGLQTPIVLGYLKPHIYLPAGIDTAYKEYVIAHENTHIRRKDYILKMTAYLAVCLHWFNPAVWCAYDFMAKDMEMACDEETIAQIGLEKRKEYAYTLLGLSAGNGNIFTVPPAFGEGDIHMRIQNIMHYQRTTKRAAALAAAAVIFLIGIFLTADEQNDSRAIAQTSSAAQNTVQQNVEQSNAQTLTFEMVREAFVQKTIGQMDFRSYTNGTKKETYEDDLSYYIDFYFRYENEEYRFQTSCAVSNDQLEDIYITRNSDSKICWLYTVDEDGERYPGDLEIFLRTKTSIDDWLTLELPEGYEIGPYNGNLGYIGGALIFPQVYQTQGETTFVPEHWEYAGFVGEVSAPQDIFVFEKGIPDERYFPHSNHSTEEPIGYMDTISAGLGWSTLMVHGFHDLYTAGDLGELELSGVDISSIETQSEYWYFYFVKEGAEHAYFLSLSAKEFTETEAIDIARTIKITEDEAALQRKDTIQHVLDVYFSDFLHTLTGDSRREYGREEFAGIDGYIAGKWLTATRESYKNTYGGIHSAKLKQVELLQLTEKEERTEVLANVSYTYAWGNSKEDTCKAGSLYRVVLKQEGDTWKVLDLECCNCKEVMILKNLMEKEASDLADPYEFVDGYFEQMYRNAG